MQYPIQPSSDLKVVYPQTVVPTSNEDYEKVNSKKPSECKAWLIILKRNIIHLGRSSSLILFCKTF